MEIAIFTCSVYLQLAEGRMDAIIGRKLLAMNTAVLPTDETSGGSETKVGSVFDHSTAQTNVN